jgi:hypothetical protein
MKIFLVGSKYNFDKIPPIREKLEQAGHVITVPSGFADPFKELEMQKLEKEEYLEFKDRMLKEQGKRVEANDAILVLNFDKNGQANYIGGATFLEVFKAWDLGKKIFFFNDLPNGILHDELVGMNPLVIKGDLSLVK